MRWVGLLFLLVASGVGIYAMRAGICPNHSRGEIVGQLRVWGPKNGIWEGTMIVDAGSMKRRFGNWTKTFEFSVTSEGVAKQVYKAAGVTGTLEVEYRQWLIKPSSQQSDCTVIGAKAVQ